jgi:predicted GNAT family N-acyltransferase
MSYTVRFASTRAERDAAYALRRAVFEIEQNVPRPLDRDSNDENADHVVVLAEDGACVGTGRAVRLDSRTCQIGRMAVLAAWRRRGVGEAVLTALERIAALRGLAEIVVHAQLPAESFYLKRGYARVGEPFVDQGLLHVVVRRHLPGAPSKAPDAPAGA